MCVDTHVHNIYAHVQHMYYIHVCIHTYINTHANTHSYMYAFNDNGCWRDCLAVKRTFCFSRGLRYVF